MHIQFLNAKRISLNSVEATYSLDDTEFTVEWNNIHPGTGEVGDYDLQLNTKSLNADLASRVDDAIREGEIDSNTDLELYLFIRDTFDRMDCASCETPAFEINSEEEFDADHYGNGRYLTRLGGCSDYEGKFGLGDWTYQFEVLVTNQSGDTRSFTVAYQPEERNNGLKYYSGYDVTTAALYGYDADESDELERFCDYDTSVLDALHEKAWNAAKAEYNRLISLLNDSELEPNND